MAYETTKAELLQKIDEFLGDSPVESADGGYAPVGEHDIRKLRDIMYILEALKYRPDVDGDRPLDFKVWDRSEGRWVGETFIKHHGRNPNPEDIYFEIRSLSIDIGGIAREIERLNELYYRLERRNEEKNVP